MTVTGSPRGNLVHNLVAFCHVLRAHGLRVSSAEIRGALEAVVVTDLADREEFRLALRATLASDPDELAKFDRLFELFWNAESSADQVAPAAGKDRSGGDGEDGSESAIMRELWDQTERPADDEEPLESARHSRAERIGAADFASFHADDLAEVARAVNALARRLSTRPSRRREPARDLARLDMRRTMRRNLGRYGDTVIELQGQRPKRRKTKLVLLCDVSRSMDVYSRLLLVFVHAMQRSVGRVESFVFSTQLTRVSRYLRSDDVLSAVERMVREVPDWGGGTRIGHSLATFVDEHGRTQLNTRTVVLILSDGLDTDEPEVVQSAMREIARRCALVLWLNPLLGLEGYEPLARGMSAALPYIDVFAPAHNLTSLRDLARRL